MASSSRAISALVFSNAMGLGLFVIAGRMLPVLQLACLPVPLLALRQGSTLCAGLQPAVALAVVAAALLHPFQAAVAVAGLVQPVLIEAGLPAGLAGRLVAIFGGDGAGKHR